MFQVEVDHLICTLWDTLRPRSPVREYPDYKSSGCDTVTEPGLMTTLDLRLSLYLNSKMYDASAIVHTLFTSNTSVFVAVTRDFERWDDIEIENFLNTSNHDSCWRSDGMRNLRKLFFKMTTELNDELVADGLSRHKTNAFQQFSTLGALGSSKPWELVKVTHSRGEDYGPGRRKLVSIAKRDLQSGVLSRNSSKIVGEEKHVEE